MLSGHYRAVLNSKVFFGCDNESVLMFIIKETLNFWTFQPITLPKPKIDFLVVFKYLANMKVYLVNMKVIGKYEGIEVVRSLDI